MLWIKNIDHFMILDLRKISKGGRAEVLSIINIDYNIVKSYDFLFEVV